MSVVHYDSLIRNVRNLMEGSGMTQQELGKIAGMTQSAVSTALNPKNSQNFTLEQVFRIANHFDCSVDMLIGNILPYKRTENLRPLFRFLAELLATGEARITNITERETVCAAAENENDLSEADVETVEITYPAIIFPEHYDPKNDPDPTAQTAPENSAVGNETRFVGFNQCLRELSPLIHLYTENVISGEILQSLVDHILQKLK